jgi:dipeptidyl aminopeptidase/acylaminoacyl peptidase
LNPLVLLACVLGTAALAQPAASAASAASAAAALPPAEAFFQNPDVLDAQLSPAGTHLAFTTAAGTDRVALVVVDLAPGGRATRAAHYTDADVVRFNWVNNQRLIFSLADLESGSGDEQNFIPGTYAVDADGENLRVLIGPRFGEIKELRSGRRMDREALPWFYVVLHMPPPQPGVNNEEIIVGSMAFGLDEALSQVTPMWLNVNTGRTRSIDLQAPAGSVGWLFDSRGEARVAVTQNKGRQAVHWRGPAQTAWQLLSESEQLRAPFAPHHVDDAGNLYVSHQSGPLGYAVLSRYDFERRAPAAQPWVSAPGFDVNGTVLRGRAGATVAGVRMETDAEVTVWFDPQMKALQQMVDERLPNGINRISCQRCGDADMVVLVNHYSDHHPGQYWLYSAVGKKWRLVFQAMAGINPVQMANVDFERIKARDGRDLPLWLTMPAGRKPGSPGPAVVLVHGGPWVRGGHWRWNALEQFLASRGYLVISPEFRGSLGYGKAHFEAGWKQWGQAMQDDVADAVLWAQARGLASKQVCIAGASYGGYATLMGLVRHPELYRCGVAWAAVTDPFLFLEGSMWIPDDITKAGRRHSLPQMVGDAKADAAMLTSVSPLAQAERIRAPLLLAYGEADLRVPLAHGKRLREALQKAGREPQWVTYRDEGHSWRLPQTQADFAQRLEKFLAEHLR